MSLLQTFANWMAPTQSTAVRQANAQWHNNHQSIDYFVTTTYLISMTKLNSKPPQILFNACKTNATKGNSIAIFNLAQLYYYGIGTEKDLKKAFELYNKCDNKNSTALNKVGMMWRTGEGTEVECKESNECFFNASDLANCNAMKNLGDSYMKGFGFAKNVKESIKWYSKAIELKHTGAMVSLGEIYDETVENELDLKKYKNCDKAYGLYFKASSLGNSQGFTHIINLTKIIHKKEEHEVIDLILGDMNDSNLLGPPLSDYIYDYFKKTNDLKILEIIFKYSKINKYAYTALKFIYENEIANVIHYWNDNVDNPDKETVLNNLLVASQTG